LAFFRRAPKAGTAQERRGRKLGIIKINNQGRAFMVSAKTALNSVARFNT